MFNIKSIHVLNNKTFKHLLKNVSKKLKENEKTEEEERRRRSSALPQIGGLSLNSQEGERETSHKGV